MSKIKPYLHFIFFSITCLSVLVGFIITNIKNSSPKSDNLHQSTSQKHDKTSKNEKHEATNKNQVMDHMGMANEVFDDKSFIESMIPHHQETVETSKLTLQTTQDPDLKVFLNNVITDQTKEIDEMKIWYKTWYNQDYTENGKYTAMMGDLSKYTGSERDKMYVEGMIVHHKGAIEMAQSVLKTTQKEEIKILANNIIANQNNEIKQLDGWMKLKYNETGSKMLHK